MYTFEGFDDDGNEYWVDATEKYAIWYTNEDAFYWYLNIGPLADIHTNFAPIWGFGDKMKQCPNDAEYTYEWEYTDH